MTNIEHPTKKSGNTKLGHRINPETVTEKLDNRLKRIKEVKSLSDGKYRFSLPIN